MTKEHWPKSKGYQKIMNLSHYTFSKHLAALLLYLLFLWILYSICDHLVNNDADFINIKSETKYTNDVEDLIDAIVLVSVGNTEQDINVDKSLKALRFQSSLSIWIPIYLFTDKISHHTSIQLLHTYFLDKLNINIYQISNDTSMSTVNEVSIFKYLPPSINTILYLDKNIIATHEFDEYYIPTFHSEIYSKKNCSIIILPGKTQNEKFNSGAFVASRLETTKCQSIYQSDQIDASKEANDCINRICLLPQNFVKFESFWTFLMLKKPPLIQC